MDLAFGQARSRGQNWPEEQEGQSICHSDQNSTPECSEKGGGLFLWVRRGGNWLRTWARPAQSLDTLLLNGTLQHWDVCSFGL